MIATFQYALWKKHESGKQLRSRFLLSALALMLTLPCVTAAQDAKQPVPDDPARQKALAAIKEVFGGEWADAQTDEQKQALAKKLLAKAREYGDPANKYILLRVGRDVATSAGDGLTAYRAIDEMDRAFQVDAVTMKASVLYSLSKKARLPADHKSIAERAVALVEQAIAKDEYETAIKLAEMALDEARKARDAEVVKAVVARKKELDDLAEAFAEVQAAAKTLETDPTDPAANLAVGKYRCVVKGDWDTGLPMLALGSDSVLKAVAVTDIEGATDHEDQVSLGDEWWDLAKKEEGKTQKRLLGRAAYWYGKALPGLTGLVKDRVDKRLSELTGKTPVDLLRLFDPKKHSVEGSWQRDGSALTARSKSTHARIVIPHTFSRSYQLRVVFVRKRGDNTVGVVLPVGKGCCVFGVSCLYNKYSGIRSINGVDVPDNGSHVACRIANNRKYELKIDVQLHGQRATITGYLNGEPHVRWEGTQTALSVSDKWRLSRPALGLWAPNSDMTFYVMELTEAGY